MEWKKWNAQQMDKWNGWNGQNGNGMEQHTINTYPPFTLSRARYFGVAATSRRHGGFPDAGLRAAVANTTSALRRSRAKLLRSDRGDAGALAYALARR